MGRITADEFAHAIGRHSFKSRIPINRIVATRFPRMDQGHQAGAMRVAAVVEPLMPAMNLGQQRPRPFCGRGIGAAVKNAIDSKPRNRGLRDARGWNRPVRGPHVGAGKIAIVHLVENDMRHHAVVPLMGKKGFHLGPCAGFVKMGKAQRAERTVPIPLKRIEPVRRYGIGAAIIVAHDHFGPFDDFVFHSHLN